MKYQLELVHIFIPQLEAYKFHFDFAGRDALLPTRSPCDCFHTIKGGVLSVYILSSKSNHTLLLFLNDR